MTIHKYIPESKLKIFDTLVPAGFPSPADDFLSKDIDLNEILVHNKAATFIIKVEGDSMIGAGIYDGDLLVVDRSKNIQYGEIALIYLDGAFTVKRVLMKGSKYFLRAENPKYKDMYIHPEQDFRVWGIVTYSIHRC